MKKLFMVFLIGMSAIGYANTGEKEFKNIKKLEDEMEKCFMKNKISSSEYKTFNVTFKNQDLLEKNDTLSNKKELKITEKIEVELEKYFMRNEINSFEYKTFNMDFKDRNSEEINKK